MIGWLKNLYNNLSKKPWYRESYEDQKYDEMRDERMGL